MQILPAVLDAPETIAAIDEIILELAEAGGAGEEERGNIDSLGHTPFPTSPEQPRGSSAGVTVCVFRAAAWWRRDGGDSYQLPI